MSKSELQIAKSLQQEVAAMTPEQKSKSIPELLSTVVAGGVDVIKAVVEAVSATIKKGQ